VAEEHPHRHRKLTDAAGRSGRIEPAPVPPRRDAELSNDVWGFKDTGFFINERGEVELSGGRYGLSRAPMPYLIGWVRDTFGCEVTPDKVKASQYPPRLPKPQVHPRFLEDMLELLGEDGVSVDGETRLRHGRGQTQEEIFSIRYGEITRMPDLVVYPNSEGDVERIVEAAIQHDVCLIPYGGGTNVTDALRCPVEEKRTIASVDLARLNHILWIDPVNLIARIEAGAIGRVLADQLAEHGFTMGHEPDSIDHSTLGGWIATYASGMKKNRYGNIEELVIDVSAVTPAGRIERRAIVPRESAGADPKRWMLGSEGSLGIITSAAVRIYPLPEETAYEAILFKMLEDGVAFMHALMRSGATPASVRLMDNGMFHFGQALRPVSAGIRKARGRLERWILTKVRGFDLDTLVGCTLVFEGTRAEVRAQQRAAYAIAQRHGGMRAGASSGERGYQLTFAIAYIRDFIMPYYILAESFETSVCWDRAVELRENVIRRVKAEHAARKLPGKPLIMARIQKPYHTGVAIYFYCGIYYQGVSDPVQVYMDIENAAREEILRCGGALSHHHGVGKIRRGYLPQVMSKATLEWTRRIKRAVDGQNIFGCGNQQVDDPGSDEA
jgi:alkyldihydroxyacetonephosphate synthase